MRTARYLPKYNTNPLIPKEIKADFTRKRQNA